MKIKKIMTLAGMGAALAAGIHHWCRSKKIKAGTPKTARNPFEDVWTGVFRENAAVYNGLFSGLLRVYSDSAKKPEKVLREWCQRTHYRWENREADLLCRQHILPAVESADREALKQWAELLLRAAAAAGITREPAQTLVLTPDNMDDYVEWNGAEPEPGDTVRVIAPAWYQSGTLLEQGQCEKTEETLF